MTILRNVPVPQDAFIAPHEEFKYLGVHNRFISQVGEKVNLYSATGIPKWNLQ